MSQDSKEGLGFKRLKFIGYCMSQTPPEGMTLEDFVLYAKFRLCEWRGYVMEDPVWDKYGDEQLLVEYYATRFEKDEKFRDEYNRENSLNGYEEAVDWMDQEIAKNAEEIKNLKPTSMGEEDEFEYTPSVVDEDRK